MHHWHQRCGASLHVSAHEMCTFELTANKQTSKQAGRQACMHSQETHMAHILQINVIISMHSFMKTTAIHHRRHFFLFGIDKCRSENQRFPSRKPLGIFNLKTIIVLHFNRIISPSFFALESCEAFSIIIKFWIFNKYSSIWIWIIVSIYYTL